MGYRKIRNLYQDQTVLMFKELYSLEKVHGTSSNISWFPEENSASVFSGGAKHETFEALFDIPAFESKARDLLRPDCITRFYGEAYGGKMQGMRDTYGPDLRFICFEVKIGNVCLDVPAAESLAREFGIEFVPYTRVPATIEAVDAERDKPSEVATRRGVQEDRPREGVVLRPVVEMRLNNGSHVLAKHKGESFRERKSVPKVVDPARVELLKDAEAIADEWVVPMRMSHVLDALGCGLDITKTSSVVKAVVSDVEEESEGLVEMTREARKAIGKRAAGLYRAMLKAQLT